METSASYCKRFKLKCIRVQQVLIKETFLEALVYGDYVEQDAKKVVDLFNQKTSTTHIKKKKHLRLNIYVYNQRQSSMLDKLLVNNSCFFRMYEIGKDSPKTRALAALL